NKERPDGLYVTGGALIINNQKRVVGLALKSRVPLMYQSREAVEAGGLTSYGADPGGSYPRARYYVARNFKGAKPPHFPEARAPRFGGRAAQEVRAGHQFEDGKSDRSEHPAVHAVSGG